MSKATNSGGDAVIVEREELLRLPRLPLMPPLMPAPRDLQLNRLLEPALAPETLPYVVIDVARLGGNRSARPFKDVLKPLKPKKSTKTRESSFLYLFYDYAADTDEMWWKLGNTGDLKTYQSKERWAPRSVWHGYVQVQHHGTLLERLLKRYFGGRHGRTSEWFVDCTAQVEAFVRALRANAHLQRETPFRMLNVEPFAGAFTGRHQASVDDYLSLFRVRDRDGRLYRLTSANIECTVAKMLTPPFLDVADAQPPRRPPSPAIARRRR